MKSREGVQVKQHLVTPHALASSADDSDTPLQPHTQSYDILNMTRYTKLEGRKKEALPSSNFFGDSNNKFPKPSVGESGRAQPDSPTSEASAQGLSVPDGSDGSNHEDSARKEQSHPAETPGADVQTDSGSQSNPDAESREGEGNTTTDDQADVVKLMKRSKLLRLKAKKAKTPEKKKALTKELRQIGSQIAQMGPPPNQPKGKDMKRKREEGDTRGNHKRTFTLEDRTEFRRQKRAEERHSNMHCFACRGQGHSAKSCPNTLNASSTALESEAPGASGVTGSSVVGICFRCGSKEHTLAQCTLPGGGKGAARGGKNLPFATCFVCGQKGHLSLACPENKSRGVYPNGGSCKLCQSVEHLVRDCPLREQQVVSDPKLSAAIADQPGEVRADEDDFHAFSRTRHEIDTGEAEATKQGKDLARRRAPPPSGAGARAQKPLNKKVVTF